MCPAGVRRWVEAPDYFRITLSGVRGAVSRVAGKSGATGGLAAVVSIWAMAGVDVTSVTIPVIRSKGMDAKMES